MKEAFKVTFNLAIIKYTWEHFKTTLDRLTSGEPLLHVKHAFFMRTNRSGLLTDIPVICYHARRGVVQYLFGRRHTLGQNYRTMLIPPKKLCFGGLKTHQPLMLSRLQSNLSTLSPIVVSETTQLGSLLHFLCHCCISQNRKRHWKLTSVVHIGIKTRNVIIKFIMTYVTIEPL